MTAELGAPTHVNGPLNFARLPSFISLHSPRTI